WSGCCKTVQRALTVTTAVSLIVLRLPVKVFWAALIKPIKRSLSVLIW
ncbi:11468_t:CDS:1, partial [Funneliformis geosporum]